MKPYLTEENLGIILNKELQFIHDKKVPNSGCNLRPDFRSDELTDSYTHLTLPTTPYV